MVARALELPARTSAGATRWWACSNEADHVRLRVDTPDGTFDIEADWLIVADGARSPIRNHAGPGDRGPHLHGPLPDRRRDHEGRLPGRALVLVRPAVPPQPERAAAQAERQRLAHRLPARLGRRPRGREEARERHPPPQGHAGRRPTVRPGMGQRLHLPVPAHEGLPRTAACCSWATRRTRCRRSARAAPTRASRTPTT